MGELSEPTQFANVLFDYHFAKSDFEERLEKFGIVFDRIGGDEYDLSLEIYEVNDDCRLSDECQMFIYHSGFAKVYVNHHDGWETHYTWTDGKPVIGWRRRRREGGFDISYWPEGWTGKACEGWLASGYMKIVPDPLSIALLRSKEAGRG